MHISPVRLIVYGFLLLLFGFLAAFAMVIQLIEASFWLSFVAYGASLVGLVIGLFGVARLR